MIGVLKIILKGGLLTFVIVIIVKGDCWLKIIIVVNEANKSQF